MLLQETFQGKIQDLMRIRQGDAVRAASQQEAAIAAALEKVKAEQQTPTPDTTKHAEELRALEETLKKQHEEELQKAVANASSSTTQSSDDSIKAAVEAAVATHEQEWKATKEKVVAEAVERGRMEQIAKAKIKDAQLVRTQTKLKDLEGQVQEWRAKGLIPAAPTATTPTTGAPAAGPSNSSGSTGTTATTTHRGGVPTQPARGGRAVSGRTPVGPGAATNALPQRPGAAHPHPQGTVGRGRGAAVRGGVPRPSVTAASGLAIRGAAPAATTQAATAAATPAGGVSIMGAANKRAREEGEVTSDDSLAKRLKPTEGGSPAIAATASGSGTSKPVPIRRDRVKETGS